MERRITPEQFREYERQSTQPVADGDVEGQRRKQNAAYWVAYCYWYGTGGVDNGQEALRILEQVIREQDDIDGDDPNDNTGKHRYLLADVVEDEDEERSSRLFRQAVPRLEMEVQLGGNDESYSEAAHYLGRCLFRGIGVDEDKSRAIHWWKKAAELGNGWAQTMIEDNCLEEPFVAEIFSWLQEIADLNNNPWAQCQLGWCHDHELGVKKDLVKAVELYNKAIAQGYEYASRCKQWLLNRLSPEEHIKTLGCVTRSQKIEKATSLIPQSFVGGVPLSLWSHALASFQRQENPPWEAPSPTFLSLKDVIMPQLQKLLSNKNQKKRKKHGGRVG